MERDAPHLRLALGLAVSQSKRELRCIRLAAAFREQAKKLDVMGQPSVAEALRASARTAERAAGLVRFRETERGATNGVH